MKNIEEVKDTISQMIVERNNRIQNLKQTLMICNDDKIPLIKQTICKLCNENSAYETSLSLLNQLKPTDIGRNALQEEIAQITASNLRLEAEWNRIDLRLRKIIGRLKSIENDIKHVVESMDHDLNGPNKHDKIFRDKESNE